MKKYFNKPALIILSLFIISIMAYVKLQPLREYYNLPPYSGPTNFSWNNLRHDSLKKTVLIMADNEMTELFDLLTPFYIFSTTAKANVYIIAQQKYPVLTQNGPFILPHFSYGEIDSLKIRPDVIVIPFMNSPESTEKTSWLTKHYSDSVIILSICDGAWTAAASGLYDGLPLTSHATGHENLKNQYSKPIWIQNISYIQSGRLFSTGGVSNAMEGSLAVVEKLFGKETMLQVMNHAKYPYREMRTNHNSIPINLINILSGVHKVFLKQNKNIGILLQSEISELDLAVLYDIYARTMPASIQGIGLNGNTIITKHGLTVISTDRVIASEIDELHILNPKSLTDQQLAPFNKARWISHYTRSENYILDDCLQIIKEEYGASFRDFVKRTLDYN